MYCTYVHLKFLCTIYVLVARLLLSLMHEAATCYYRDCITVLYVGKERAPYSPLPTQSVWVRAVSSAFDEQGALLNLNTIRAFPFPQPDSQATGPYVNL